MKIIYYVFLLILLFAQSMIQAGCYTDSCKYEFVGCFNDNENIKAIPNYIKIFSWVKKVENGKSWKI